MRESLTRVLDRWLPRGGIARSVSILAGGTALAQVVAIAASPILTRIYHPADFGALQVFISLMTFALAAASGRYEVAILLPEDEQGSIDVLAVATLCVCLTAAIAAGLVAVSHFYWILPSSVSALRGYLWLLPLGILGAGLYQVLTYWATRHSGYSQIAKSKFTQVTTQVAAQLGIGLLVHGSIGLLVGDTIGRMTGSGRFIRDLCRDSSEQIRAIRLSSMFKLAVRYREYPLVSMWGALISMTGMALPSLFLAQYYGTQATGWFALVARVLGVPSALISLSIAQVYMSEAAKLKRSNPNRLMYIFLKTTRRMLYLGLVPCVLFTVLAPWIFQVIFGQPWREAGEYARSLAVMFFASFVNSPVQFTLNILERQRAEFVWTACRLAVTALAIAVPYHLGYGQRRAILSYGLTMTVMYAIHWTQSYSAIRRCVKQAPVSLTSGACA